MKAFALGFLAAIVLLPLGVLGYLRMGWANARADSPPPVWESRLMRAAVHAAVARSAAGVTAPKVASDEDRVAGGKLYMEGCAGCHGELGKPYAEERDHYPRVPQVLHVGTDYSEPQIYWIVKHGIGMTAMSAYGPFYSEEQLWAIAAFLHDARSLPPGVADRILAKAAEGKPGG